MPYRSSSSYNNNNKMIPPPILSSPSSPTTGVPSRRYQSGISGMNQYPSTSSPYSSSPPRRVGGGQRSSSSSFSPTKDSPELPKKKNNGGMLSSFLMQHQQDRSPTATAGGGVGGAGAVDVLSIGETIMTEDLEDKGLQRVIEIQSNGSHHSRSGNHHHNRHHQQHQYQHHSRGNRPALDRRISILSLEDDDDQSYIMDLASQKERRAHERHEEALEEALEKVNSLVRAMDRPQRPSTDSEEYALLFLKVLAKTKAALQIKYEQHDKMMDEKLDEALREGINRRRCSTNDNGEATTLTTTTTTTSTTTNNNPLYQSASSGLANICEDQSSCSSGSSSSNTGNGNGNGSGSSNGDGIARRRGHKSFGDDEHTDPTHSTSTRTTMTTAAGATFGGGPFTAVEQKAACVKIQSTYRRYRVQSVFGPLLEGVHVHQERVQRQHRAVTRIQAAYRGHRTRGYFVEVLQGVREKKVRSQAAVRIQAVCRRYMTRVFYLELMDGLKAKNRLEQEKDHLSIEDELTVDSDNEEEILLVDDASYWDATVDGTLTEEEFFEESIDDLDEEYMEFSEDEIEIVDDGSGTGKPTTDKANAAVVDSKGGKSCGKWTTERIMTSSTEQTASLKTVSPTKLRSSQYQTRLAANATCNNTWQSPMSPTGKSLRSPSGTLAERMKMFESPKPGLGVPLTFSKAKRTWQKPSEITISLDGDEQKPGGGPVDPSPPSAFAAVLTPKGKPRSVFANQSNEVCDEVKKSETANVTGTPKNGKSKVVYDSSVLKKKLKKVEKMIVECNDPMELEKLRKKQQSYIDDMGKQDEAKAQGRDDRPTVLNGMCGKKGISSMSFPPTIPRDGTQQPTQVPSTRMAGSALTRLTNASPLPLESKDDVAFMKTKTCSFPGKPAVAAFAPSSKKSEATELSSFQQQLSPKDDPASEKKSLSSTRSSEERPCSSSPVCPEVLSSQKDVQCSSDNGQDNGPADTKYTLSDFEQKLVQGVNMAEWELYLTESEFQKHFAMSSEDFFKQPKWKREKQKRKVRVNF